jgi:monoamine oxidase
VGALIKELNIATHAHHTQGDAMYHTKPTSQRLQGNRIDVPSGRFSHSAASLTAALVAMMPDNVRVHLSRPVRSISISSEEGHAVVEYEGGAIEGGFVVLALPPVLAMHAMKFDPPLPKQVATVAARTSVWMGAIAKVVCVYNEPFWRRNGLAGAAVSHTGPLRQIHDMSGPDGKPAAIFGFAPVGQRGEAPTEAQVKAQLSQIFGPEAGRPREIIVQNWSAERFTSPPDVAALGSSRNFGHVVLREPAMHGKLFWSSTETAVDAPGHIEGAIAAAERTVKQILLACSKRS